MTTETPKTTPSKKRSKPSAGGATTDSGAPIGEGSFEGTERYAEGIEHYLAHADVEKDAADAAPHSAQEAAALKAAEIAAASRTRAPGK